jgi:UDP-N-acetylmuramoyl-tripeptide--D-alanyl-D-alanine ligase
LKLFLKGAGVQTLKETMGLLKINEILQATEGRLLCGGQEEFIGLSTDSRSIKKGELFVALRGRHFDGHHFVHDALNNGSGAIVSIPPSNHLKGKTVIYVRNTLIALHSIARYLRLKMNVPVICVTGTNGKTTVKELISSIFDKSHKVLKTFGNLNNHVGLPLSISRMDGDETIMVLEMGSNAQGDIKQLCDIAYPGYAVVTNVGPAHLEGFGDLDTVRKTDLEILEYVKVASVNSDDAFLYEGIKEFSGRIISYGLHENADVTARNIVLKDRGSSFRLCFPGGREIDINLIIGGKFNIYNALAAASITDELRVGLDNIRDGLETFRGVPMRLEIKHLLGALIISDVYNANPASVKEAIKELIRLKGQRTIAILGDMLELGAYTEEAHVQIVRFLSELSVDLLIAVGPEMSKASSEFKGNCYTAETSSEARELLINICRKGDTVLVKGSRGMEMEGVLSNLPENEGNNAL